MKIVKLTPAVKDNIWGGNRLRDWGKVTDKARIAETWELSCHPDGPSALPDGTLLPEALSAAEIGANAARFPFFPMLIKLIDAEDNLSVQVHPSDAYALAGEGQYGKTEMWYIADAQEGAGIYLGFKREVTPEEYASAIADGTITGLLNFYPVKKGEHYFIKSGTVHAIAKGVTLCEIQQNSNLTYRVYDYGRVGADGRPRDLHVEKAQAVSDLGRFADRRMEIDEGGRTRIGASKYFTAFRYEIDGAQKLAVGNNSFLSLTVVDGEGRIDGKEARRGDTYFVPAGRGSFKAEGEMTLIGATVLKYYLGIDLGGTNIKGGIIDEDGVVIVKKSVPTEAEGGAEHVVEKIVELIGALLDAANFTVSDVEGIGLGIPGMINSDKGIVTYSNNLDWYDVHIADGIRAAYDTRVEITNDANAAALGEALYGAAKDANVASVMITLGTGVGGGIIINNKIFAGNRSAGAEIGHMVIRQGGEKCTCGRRGCFEAYSSATALIRDTKRAMEKHPESKMWEIGSLDHVTGKTAFDYQSTDKAAAAVVRNYLKYLACGLANVANVFRPEIIMLGGGVCAQGDNLVKPLQRLLNRELFGGKLGPIVKVVTTVLGNDAGFLGAAALNMD